MVYALRLRSAEPWASKHFVHDLAKVQGAMKNVVVLCSTLLSHTATPPDTPAAWSCVYTVSAILSHPAETRLSRS
jgi:hypothetical protein